MEQRLYAFWVYSNGFYKPTHRCLGSEVEEFKKDGYVKMKGYGGSMFKPFKICPLEEGLELQAKLDKLDGEYESDLKTLQVKYKRLHDDLIVIPK
jgi:hypothetical protein